MYDALILVNGEIPRQELWQKLPYHMLICTDGAANTLLDPALAPDVIIGDMDSISDGPQNATTEFLKLHFPGSDIISIDDQNTTDFEKALIFSEEKHFKRVLCTGILGKSADHSIYNLSLLSRFGEAFELLALSVAHQECQWIFPLRANTTLHTQANCTLSFVAFPEATLTTKGLKWDLAQSQLSQRKHHSIRNQTVHSTIQVSCQGHCLAFLTSSILPQIEYS